MSFVISVLLMSKGLLELENYTIIRIKSIMKKRLIHSPLKIPHQIAFVSTGS